MPGNAGGGIQADMLSGIEEESDIYEAFAPHVDYTSISLSTESSPGKPQSLWLFASFSGLRYLGTFHPFNFLPPWII